MTATSDRPTSTRPRRPPRTGGLRAGGGPGWWPAFVIAAVSLIDRVETSILTGVLADLQREWGFSDTAAGSLPTAITIAGLLMALPAGYLADRVNRKNLLAVVVASWSVITLASGLAISFAMFFGTRVVLGAADNLDVPSQSSLLGDYYPPEVRPTVFGLQRMVYFAGTGVGALVGGVVSALVGWRWAFLSMILPGLLVAWWCYRLREPARGEMDRVTAAKGRAVGPEATEDLDAPDRAVATGADALETDVAARDPEQRPRPTVPATDGGAAGSAATPGGPPGAGVDDAAPARPLEGGWRGLRGQIRSVFASRTLGFLLGGIVVLFLGLNGIFFWLPTYFQRAWGLGSDLGGILTAVVIVVGVVVGTAVGAVVGRRWHGRVRGGRVLAGSIGFVVGGLLMGAGFLSDSLPLQVGLITAATAAMAVAIPNHFAAAADCMSAANRGVGFTFTQVGIAVGGSFGPLVVGSVSDRTGSLQTSYLVLLAPIVIAGLVVLGGRGSYEADAERVLTDSIGD